MPESTKWRLNITANCGDSYYLVVYEIEFREVIGGADQCAGGTATASAQYSATYSAAKAFDNDLSTSWVPPLYTTTGWIQYEFAAPKEIAEYTIMPSASAAASPRDWTLEYWDGSAWVVVDTRAGVTAWTGGVASVFTIPPNTQWGWEDYAPRSIVIADPEPWGWESYTIREWGWVDYPPRSIVIADPEPWGWESTAPAAMWAVPSGMAHREVFVCVLRKTGLSDVEVPMSSMQLRRRYGNPTLVSCVVPDAMTYLALAEARQDGEIIIYAGSVLADGTRHLSEFERAALESVSYDHGIKSSSLSLSGYRTEAITNPRPVDLDGITYYGLQADGKRRVRGQVNIFLRPGDTAVFGDESFTVDQIYVKVEARNSWMETAGA